MAGEPDDLFDVGTLRVRREIADLHVLDHATAKRAHRQRPCEMNVTVPPLLTAAGRAGSADGVGGGDEVPGVGCHVEATLAAGLDDAECLSGKKPCISNSLASSTSQVPLYAEVDVISLQLTRPRAAGVEAAGLAAMD